MYLFLFGRDHILSKIELASVLKKEEINFEKIYEADKFTVLDFEESPDFNYLISRLGGTVRIARVYHGSDNLTEEFIQKLDFYFPRNFNYTVEGLGLTEKEYSEVDGIIKKVIRNYKSKGVQKHPDQGFVDPSSYFSWRLDEGFELFVIKLNNKFFFAQTVSCSDPKQHAFKDNERPVQKFTRGTSFRLAQMMVNCLGLEEGSTIVDPFCGIGTFLIEGLIAGYNVIGIDNEKEMTDASQRNLKWAQKVFNLSREYKLITQDAQSADYRADGCVFEPFMGPFMTKLPNKQKAIKVIQMLENLYLDVFDNLYQNMTDNAPVVCVLPYLETSEGEAVQLSGKFFNRLKFHLVSKEEVAEQFDIRNPLEYDTPDGSRIRRRIYILRRNS